MKKEQIYALQGMLSAAGAWLSNKFGILYPMMMILIAMMFTDQLTGMYASKKEALDHPNDDSYGWSSVKWRKGIYKKLGYLLTAIAAIVVDYVLFRCAKYMGIMVTANTIFGLLTIIWLILNELLSITENAGRLGAPLPDFLQKVLIVMKSKVEKKANEESAGVE